VGSFVIHNRFTAADKSAPTRGKANLRRLEVAGNSRRRPTWLFVAAILMAGRPFAVVCAN
jgi:hypothetical protein